jgi:hypothetical protein
MISIENYLEIQIVGILLLLALTPLLNIFVPSKVVNDARFCPMLADLGGSNSVKFILVLVIAFVIGAAGNRLIDDFIDDMLGIEGKEKYAQDYKAWAEKNYNTSSTANNNQLTANNNPPPKTLKVAEFELGNKKDAEMNRNYFERHKFLMRILRGTAFSALLFMISVIAYCLLSAKLNLCETRYTGVHYWTAFLVLILFSAAYRLESTHYYKRVCELQTGVSNCELKID